VKWLTAKHVSFLGRRHNCRWTHSPQNSVVKQNGADLWRFSRFSRVRCCTSLMNLARCSLIWKNGRHEKEVTLGLDSGWISQPTTAYFGSCHYWRHNKCEILVVGWSGCALCLNMYKYEICGERNERCQKLWLFPSMQCTGDVENLGKVSMH